MKHLNRYKDFKTNEGWLSDKLSNASEGTKKALSAFTDPFEDIVKKIQGEWQAEFDTEVVKKSLIDNLSKSFTNMIEAISKMDNVDDIKNIYDDIDQALVQFNDSIGKEIDKMAISESVKTYKTYFLINEGQESVMAGLKAAVDTIFIKAKDMITNNREDYLKAFEAEKDAKEEKGIDTIKEEAKENLKKISKKIENDVKTLDIKKIVDEAKAKIETEKSSQNKGVQEYKPGTILKYTKKDGDDNTAEVATNQEETEDGFINMISDDGKETFVISSERIIGEADEDGDIEVTPEDITNSLEDIKGDKKAMNKLKKYIENELN